MSIAVYLLGLAMNMVPGLTWCEMFEPERGRAFVVCAPATPVISGDEYALEGDFVVCRAVDWACAVRIGKKYTLKKIRPYDESIDG